MAVTSPDNIWTPDAGDDYALTTDLAAMADTVQDALNTVKTYLPMTNAERLALTGGGLFEGLIVYTTDTNAFWKYDGAAWGLFGIGPFKTIQNSSTGAGTVTNTGSMAALTGLTVSQAVVTGVACRVKVTLTFRYDSTGLNSNAILGIAASGATSITPTTTQATTIFAASSSANVTSTFSGSWIISLNAGTTTLSLVGQAVNAGGTRTVQNVVLLVEPVNE